MPPFDVSDLVFGNDVGMALPPDPISLQFRHRTVSGVSNEADNIEFPWYWTRLNHSVLNNNPNAVLTVTPVGRIDINAETHQATLRHNDRAVGVLFRNDRWYIYNLDLSPMDINVDFNVAIHQASVD